MALIRTEELRDRIKVVIPMTAPYNASADKKKENIDSFNALSRDDYKTIKLSEESFYTKLKLEKKYICSIQESRAHEKEYAHFL